MLEGVITRAPRPTVPHELVAALVVFLLGVIATVLWLWWAYS
jgi:hypothetical protein